MHIWLCCARMSMRCIQTRLRQRLRLRLPRSVHLACMQLGQGYIPSTAMCPAGGFGGRRPPCLLRIASTTDKWYASRPLTVARPVRSVLRHRYLPSAMCSPWCVLEPVGGLVAPIPPVAGGRATIVTTDKVQGHAGHHAARGTWLAN